EGASAMPAKAFVMAASGAAVGCKRCIVIPPWTGPSCGVAARQSRTYNRARLICSVLCECAALVKAAPVFASWANASRGALGGVMKRIEFGGLALGLSSMAAAV